MQLESWLLILQAKFYFCVSLPCLISAQGDKHQSQGAKQAGGYYPCVQGAEGRRP
jgi:hypothetical protein